MRRHTSNPILVLLSICAACTATNRPVAGLSALRAETDPATICRSIDALIARLAADETARPRLDSTFESYPPLRALVVMRLTFPFRGVLVHIPAREYKVSASLNANEKRFDLQLVLPEKKGLITISRMPGEPMRDVFAIAGDTAPVSKEREEYTKKLFGKFPDLLDLISVGFTVKASGYKCNTRTPHAAVRDAIALVLKGLGPRVQTLRAFTVLGGSGAHLTIGEAVGKQFYVDLSYRHGGVPYTMTGLVRDAPFVDDLIQISGRLEAAPETFRARKEQFGEWGARVINFVNAPTIDEAKAMLREMPKPRDGRLASELERYIRLN